MKIQLLPTTFDSQLKASKFQHLCSFVIDDKIAVDAGSLAMATGESQKFSIRDIVLTHAHIDHIAGLPIFIDDLFSVLETPIKIHASQPVIDSLEKYIFNWVLYPKVTELRNEFGNLIEYCPTVNEKEFVVQHLKFTPFSVNHKVPSSGYFIADDKSRIAITGDTAEMDRFWELCNSLPNVKAILIECAFPNEMQKIATASHHLTPKILSQELEKLTVDCEIFAINLKPRYRDLICQELNEINNHKIEVFEIGEDYFF